MSLIDIAGLQGELAAVGERLRAVTAVVRAESNRRRAPGGGGSGIVVSADGLVVTNAHVATHDRATLELPGGRTSGARVVARDPRRDLALLRPDDAPECDPAALPTAGVPAVATFGEPARLRPGDLVVALGHPSGVEHALAVGVVHAVAGPDRGPRLVRADIRLAPGNSGGPLADALGRVVGVNAMIVGGLGVAISADEVRDFLARAAPRPSLGVSLRSVRVPGGDARADAAFGLLVLETAAGGAAERGGVLPGDVLLGHAGRPFPSADALLALLGDAGAGGSLRLDVLRAGRRMTCTVLLGGVDDATRRAA